MSQHITVGQFIEELQRQAEPQARFVIDDELEFDFWAPSRATELVVRTVDPRVAENEVELARLEEEMEEARSVNLELKDILIDIHNEIINGDDDPVKLTAKILELIAKANL